MIHFTRDDKITIAVVSGALIFAALLLAVALYFCSPRITETATGKTIDWRVAFPDGATNQKRLDHGWSSFDLDGHSFLRHSFDNRQGYQESFIQVK